MGEKTCSYIYKLCMEKLLWAIITLYNSVNTVFTMSTDQEQMQQDIQGLDRPWGWTRTAGALAAAIEIFTSDGKWLLLIIK